LFDHGINFLEGMHFIRVILTEAAIQSREKGGIILVRQRDGREDFSGEARLILGAQFADGFADFRHGAHAEG
jgi:hypothetical protein